MALQIKERSAATPEFSSAAANVFSFGE